MGDWPKLQSASYEIKELPYASGPSAVSPLADESIFFANPQLSRISPDLLYAID